MYGFDKMQTTELDGKALELYQPAAGAPRSEIAAGVARGQQLRAEAIGRPSTA